MLFKKPTAADNQSINDLVQQAYAAVPQSYDLMTSAAKALMGPESFQNSLELAAVSKTQIIGYGLLRPVTIRSEINLVTGLNLSILAVRPAYQRQGIGQQLVAALEQNAVMAGYTFITVVGQPDYYQRLGYIPASQFGLETPADKPTAAHLLKVLGPNQLKFKRTIGQDTAVFES